MILSIDGNLTTSYEIILSKIQIKSNTSINVFRYKNKEVYPICLSKTFFENHMKLLLSLLPY